jgi:hypothetical protein
MALGVDLGDVAEEQGQHERHALDAINNQYPHHDAHSLAIGQSYREHGYISRRHLLHPNLNPKRPPESVLSVSCTSFTT